MPMRPPVIVGSVQGITRTIRDCLTQLSHEGGLLSATSGSVLHDDQQILLQILMLRVCGLGRVAM
jgi:hypothetical protein